MAAPMLCPACPIERVPSRTRCARSAFWAPPVMRCSVCCVSCASVCSIWPVASAVLAERFFTSVATTAKLLPDSPARAASMAAFSASSCVWRAICEISSETFETCASASLSAPIWLSRSVTPSTRPWMSSSDASMVCCDDCTRAAVLVLTSRIARAALAIWWLPASVCAADSRSAWQTVAWCWTRVATSSTWPDTSQISMPRRPACAAISPTIPSEFPVRNVRRRLKRKRGIACLQWAGISCINNLRLTIAHLCILRSRFAPARRFLFVARDLQRSNTRMLFQAIFLSGRQLEIAYPAIYIDRP